MLVSRDEVTSALNTPNDMREREIETGMTEESLSNIEALVTSLSQPQTVKRIPKNQT